MVYVGRRIVLFFKPLVENAKRITVVCLTADSTVFFKWAKELEFFELFAQKSKVVFRRANVFYKIDRLHAKIYIFDNRVFLSSANLTYGSLYVNIEHAIEVTERKEKQEILDYLEKLRYEHREMAK
jgi:phosphatidylserine/phosphatidylglycerophosphate/cardiolipin synthase-like enzyme